MTASIVVGVDGTPESVHALQWAAAVAARRGADVRAVLAWSGGETIDLALDPLGAPGAAPVVDPAMLLEAARRRLDDAIRAAALDVPVAADVVADHPAWGLVESSRHAAMLVVGARAHTGHSTIGSVARGCVEHASVPVGVVPHGDDVRAHLPVRRIAVGIDASPTARAALRLADEEARRWDAALTAIGAWEPTAWPAGFRLDLTDEQIAARVEERLAVEVAEVLGDRVDQVELRAVRGPLAPAIVEGARDADILVVGVRGRGGFVGHLLGSVSGRILDLAACPVIVVPRRSE